MLPVPIIRGLRAGLIVAVLAWVCAGLEAEIRSSASYRVRAETMDGGGRTSASSSYSKSDSLEPHSVGAAAAGAYAVRHGFVNGFTVSIPAGLSIRSVTPDSPEPGAVTIEFVGLPGAIYAIEETVDLVQGPWTAVGNATVSVAGLGTFVRANAPSNAFYRVRFVSDPSTSPRLNITSVTLNSPGPGDVTIAITGSPGAVYAIDETVDLIQGPWNAIGEVTASPDGLGLLVRSDAPPRAFYRVRMIGGP